MADPGHIPMEAPSAPRRRAGVLPVLTPVLAVVALVLAFLPGACYVAGLPALAAIVLAVVLLARGAARLVAALSAAVAIVAVVVAIVVSIAQFTQVVQRFSAGLPSLDDPPSAGPGDPGSTEAPDGDATAPGPRGTVDALAAGTHRVTYQVLGSGTARVAYTAFVDGRFGVSDEPSVAVPHKRAQRVRVGQDEGAARFAMIVTAVGDARDGLGCRIAIDGRVVSERAAGGSSSVAECTVSAG